MTIAQAVDLLEQVVSGNVSDAMERLRLPRRVLTGFTVLGQARRPVVGPAFTVEQGWKESHVERSERLVRHGEVTRGLARAGDVIVIATGGITEVATWGENHSMRCRRSGVRGLVTDGATRDAELVGKADFPVHCRGISPIKSQWDLKTISLNAPVTIANVAIAPGDIMFADESGILVMAPEVALDVAILARDIRNMELKYQEALP
ncbi:MAG: RraA family protein [Microvirga sp.]